VLTRRINTHLAMFRHGDGSAHEHEGSVWQSLNFVKESLPWRRRPPGGSSGDLCKIRLPAMAPPVARRILRTISFLPRPVACRTKP
jgi:hypothetical protein